MKNKIIVFLTILLFSTLWFGCSSNKKEEDVIKVGAILPLSGNLAVIGEPEKKSIELFRKIYPDSKVQIFIDDSQGDPKHTVSIIKRMINLNGIRNFIISTSPSILSAIPVVKDINGVLFAVTSTPDIADGKNVFQIFPNSKDEILSLVNWMKEQTIDSIAFVYPNNEFGTMIWDLFSKRYHGVITFSEAYQIGSTDLRSLLFKIKAKNPKWISFQGYPNDIPTFIKQAREIGLSTNFITSMATTWPSTLSNLTSMGETPIFMVPVVMLEQARFSEANKFYKEFVANSGATPNWDAYYVFDVLQIIQSFSAVGKRYKSEELKKYLLDTVHKTISGSIKLKQNGSIKVKFITATIKNGNIIRMNH